jgi:hypothetical protein
MMIEASVSGPESARGNLPARRLKFQRPNKPVCRPDFAPSAWRSQADFAIMDASFTRPLAAADRASFDSFA